MPIRHLAPMAVLLATLCGAQGPSPAPGVAAFHGTLPIALPAGASVNFEADAPGSELLPVIRNLAAAGFLETGARPETILIKTGIGDIELRPTDVADILRPVREMHIVSFALPKDSQSDPVHDYEDQFASEGMHRISNDNGILLMRRTGDRYALVIHERDKVTVLRVDGMPDLGAATKVVLRAIGKAAQRAGKDKGS